MINAINRAEVLRFLIKPWRRDELEETAAALRRHSVLQRERNELAAAYRIIIGQERHINLLNAELARLKSTQAQRALQPAMTLKFVLSSRPSSRY